VRDWTVPVSWALASPATLALPEPHSLAIGPFGSSLLVSDYRAQGVPVVFVRHIRSGRFDDPPVYVDAAKAEELKPHWAYEGDLLVTKMGDPPGDTCIYPSGRGPAVITSDCLRFKVDEKLALPRFVMYALRSAGGQQVVGQITRGVAQRKVSLGRFAGIELPVAPLAEQHRIVAKLDELFSELDAGVAALERAQAKLERYRASVLKAAVEGRLTERWRQENPPTETGAELLERILAGRRQRWEEAQRAAFEAKGKGPPKNWKKKCKEPVAPIPDGLPGLPWGWCWASLDQVGLVVTGTTPPQEHRRDPEPALPFIKPTELDAGYWVAGAREYLGKSATSGARILAPYSVLVTCIGATIGKAGLARVACMTNQQINSVDVGGCETLGKYLYWVLSSSWGQGLIISSAAATTLPILNRSKFLRIPVPVPPLAEMVTIIGELERLDSAAQATRNACASATGRARVLRQSILAAAFEGRLVPQDPDDEPASVLLERIRAERGKERSTAATRACARKPAAERTKPNT
jgi:type I restriction enzyme, S subunit